MSSFNILFFAFPIIMFVASTILSVIFIKRKQKQNEQYVTDLEAKLKQINDAERIGHIGS